MGILYVRYGGETMTEKRTYKYAVVQEGAEKYVDVEMAGRAKIYDGENPEDRAKDLIVSTQQVPENTIKLQKVKNLDVGVITSQQTENK